MKDDSEGCGAAIFLSSITAALVAAVVGAIGVCLKERAISNFKQEAVENNVAEWVVTDSTGKTEFRWKKPKEAP